MAVAFFMKYLALTIARPRLQHIVEELVASETHMLAGATRWPGFLFY